MPSVGFIHDIRAWNAALGACYRDLGGAYSRILAEEVGTSYGVDLEAFIEKRLGHRMSVRLTGSNLLDASKDDFFNKLDIRGGPAGPRLR